MSIRICLFLCLLFCGTGLFAQAIIQGKVQIADQSAEGATITLSGPVKWQTTTRSDGQFRVEGLPAGTYTLSCSFSGYQTSRQELQIPGKNESIIISLDPLPQSLQPVEIKALRAGVLAPFTKTNINRAFIEKNNLGQDIPFLLNQTPNVVVNSDAGNGIGYTGIRIRGSDATRINMTINGIPYNDPESQGTFFVNLPDFSSSVSSVQIQRGVGTSSNGAGAFGASMNFSTNEYNDKPYAELNNSFGSFNSFKNTIRVGSGLINKQFTLDARLSRISSDGFIDRASTNLLGAYLSGAWYLPKSTLRFNAILGKEKTYQSWYGISEADLKNNRTFNSAGTAKPGTPYENEADNYKQNHYQLFYNTSITNRLQFNTALYLTTGQGYYEQYRADEDPADYGINVNTTTDLIRQLWLKNKMYGQIFSLQYKTPKDEISLGGGWSRYPGQHFGKVVRSINQPLPTPFTWYDFDALKTDINLYAKWQRQLSDHWFAFSDLQYRHVNYTIEGFRNNPEIRTNQTWNFVNPKAGVTYKNGNWMAYGSYALANKEPNRDDFEAGAGEIPKREQLHNVELGVQRSEVVPGLQLAANAYLMYYRDQLVLTGRINDVGAYVRTNIPESYRLGIELQARYKKGKTSMDYNLSLSDNRIIDYTGYYDDYDNGGQLVKNYGNSPLSFSPGIVQQATIDYQSGKRTVFTLLNKHVGRQYLDNSGEKSRSLDPYFVNDFRIAYDVPVKKLAKQVKLILQVNNFTDRKYEPNGYTFSYVAGGEFTTENFYYPMAGINYLFAVNISL